MDLAFATRTDAREIPYKRIEDAELGTVAFRVESYLTAYAEQLSRAAGALAQVLLLLQIGPHISAQDQHWSLYDTDLHAVLDPSRHSLLVHLEEGAELLDGVWPAELGQPGVVPSHSLLLAARAVDPGLNPGLNLLLYPAHSFPAQ
jgi:hypothetical protein